MEITKREKDVIRLISIGFTNPEIAKKLELSIKTVENHVRNALLRNGLKNRVQLAVTWLDYQNKLMKDGETNE